MCYNMWRKLLFLMEKEESKIKATVMSMFFRSRPPRKLRLFGKSPAKPQRKLHHKRHAPALAPGVVPARQVPVQAKYSARRSRHRPTGYMPHGPGHSRFRIT